MKGFRRVLEDNILRFWSKNMVDHTNGGFYGRMDGQGTLHPEANKGAVLNARILWSFSAAYRLFGREEYLDLAQRAFDYITEYFIDKKHGGVYWELDYKGFPANRKKQCYAQGFTLYGLSEFYRASGCNKALELAKEFYLLLERCYDTDFGGYPEAYTEDWKPIEDMRLSSKDKNEAKTMNTHLHILEPYTNLLRIWNDEALKTSQRRLINLFTDKILNTETCHLGLFFDSEWNSKSDTISFGHDIEASWLLFEAATVLNDQSVLQRIREISLRLADSTSAGALADGSLAYEQEGTHLDTERHWWVQAEAVVGYMYAWRNSGDTACLDKAKAVWEYISKVLIDHEQGEWYWSRRSDNSINTLEDKAGFWKCPYHNARMCMEMIEHFGIE